MFIAILSLAIPLLLTLPERLARLHSKSAAAAVHALMFGLLTGLIVWAALAPGLVSYLLGGITMIVAGTLRWRTSFGRSFAGILSVATPVTIVLFLASYPIAATFLPGDAGAEPGETDSETPVVMVVLDELPVAALVNDRGRIDDGLFPNFARLERESTWYRQAVTLSGHTTSALPSILTGEDPPAEPVFGEPTPPGYPAYPDTVCSVPERAGYESWSSQFVTDLCGRSESMGKRLSGLMLAGIPNHVPESINALLGGIANVERMTPGRVFERSVEKVADAFGPHYETWGSDRDKVFEEFTEGMPARPRTINLLYSALPHAEYTYLEDGTIYGSRGLFDQETALGLANPAGFNESAKNLQQLTAQTMYVDRLLGRMIGRLKEEGTWDETLFVLVSDHGASFRPGDRRRFVTAESAGWLLPIPLFIKYPGQQRGHVTDVAADIRDVTPTILESIGLEPSPRATGRNLRKDAPPPAPTIQAVDEDGDLIDLPRSLVKQRRQEAIDFRNRALDSGLYALGGHPELIGQPISSLGRPGLDFEPFPGSPFTPEVFALGGVPAYFQAELEGVKRDPGPLAVAIDGTIVATARAWQRGEGWTTGLNLPVDKEAETVPEVTIVPIDSA